MGLTWILQAAFVTSLLVWSQSSCPVHRNSEVTCEEGEQLQFWTI